MLIEIDIKLLDLEFIIFKFFFESAINAIRCKNVVVFWLSDIDLYLQLFTHP